MQLGCNIINRKIMQKGNTILIIIIVLALLIGGYFIFRGGGEDVEVLENTNNTEEEPTLNGQEIPNNAVMEDGTKIEEKTEEGKMENNGTYENYAPEKLALAENGDVVLFFHASWCPYCRAAEADINKNLSIIPDGVHILKTDYDSNTALKQKYGVTYQHTFVQVDAQGNLIKKWSGSETLSAILANIE